MEFHCMSEDVWYCDGLRFKCTGCGGCCTGAPGYVWVNRAEIAALAVSFDMTEDEFGKKFVRRVGNRYSLVERANGDCVFFDPDLRNCRVYRHRPRQCRTWPFWTSNLRSEQTWNDMASGCPGANCGKLFTPEEIEERKTVMYV